MKRSNVRFLTEAGLIGGMYTALCLLLAPFSYGPMQVRLAEALTVLPALTPAAVPGLTLGCLLANLFGGGAAGGLDWLFGTLATLAAALLSWGLRRVRWRGCPVLSTLPPVLLNALVIGAECAIAGGDGFSWPLFGLYAVQIGAGQLIACTGGGLLLAVGLQKMGENRLFHE